MDFSSEGQDVGMNGFEMPIFAGDCMTGLLWCGVEWTVGELVVSLGG